jgi:cytochrome P450
VDQLPFAPAEDPLALPERYRSLQRESPVSLVRTPAGDTAWLVCGYEQVRALTSEARLGRSHPDPDRAARLNDSVLAGGAQPGFDTEAVRHRRMRRLLAPAFSAKRVAGLRTRIGQRADELIDELARRARHGAVDLHQVLSAPLPVMVICELLGAPYRDYPRLRRWSDRIAELSDPDAARAAFREFLAYSGALLDAKRRDPGPDVFSDLAAASGRDPDGGAALSVEDAAHLALGLLFAGHETTMTRITLGTLMLIVHPDQRDALRANPALVGPAVEEILRLAGTGSSTGGILRYAGEDIRLDGLTIAAGEAVLLAYAAANRDPRRFPDPDRFDIARTPNPHLTFGHGSHFCVGASLARVELQEVFARLFDRLPGLRLAVPYDRLHRQTGRVTGGLGELPVTA